MLKYQLTSGTKVEFSLASVDKALALYRAVIQECQQSKFDLKIEEGMSQLELIGKNIEPLLRIMGSENVMEAVKDCCEKVLYNKQKFSMDLFEDEKARGDFFGLMILVSLENLLPFFPNLRTAFEPILSQFVR